MPSRLKRFHASGQTHFLTFSCYQRRPFLSTDESKRIFEAALERVRLRFHVSVYGYVVMPEHVHLLVSEPDGAPFKPSVGLSGEENNPDGAPFKPSVGLSGEENNPDGAPFKPSFGLSGGESPRTLADAIKSLKQGVSRRLLGEADHFWQKRYYDFNVRDHPQFIEKLRYIHRNPVTRGLCEQPEDWPWSSFLHYATGHKGRVEIESEWTARKRERAAGRRAPTTEFLPRSAKRRLEGDTRSESQGV